MNQALEIETIAPEALLSKAEEFRKLGYRLVQIGATRLPEGVELTYSFDLRGRLQNLRMLLPPAKAGVASISSIYWAAFLYENELHDLFNVHVDGIAVDFHGSLYKTAIKFPFGSTKVPQAKLLTAVKPPPPPTAPPGVQNAARGEASPVSPNSRN